MLKLKILKLKMELYQINGDMMIFYLYLMISLEVVFQLFLKKRMIEEKSKV
jgi:hypothetical protein